MKIKTIEHEDRFEVVITIPKDMKPVIHDRVLAMLAEVSKGTMVSQLNILGKCREMNIVSARHLFWFKLHSELNLSGKKIAQELNVDVSTVNKALTKYNHDPSKHN